MDTGTGGTIWPMNADYACEKISGPGGRNSKTATGEMVDGQGRFRVRCQSVLGHLLQMTGGKTSVHKPRLSAGDVTDKGHALWLDGNVGYIIQKDSPILTAMRTSNIVSKVEDVHLHMRLFLKENCQKLESTALTWCRKDPK